MSRTTCRRLTAGRSVRTSSTPGSAHAHEAPYLTAPANVPGTVARLHAAPAYAFIEEELG